VVADPRHRDTLYSGLNPLPVSRLADVVSRSEDAGRSWSAVAPPRGAGAGGVHAWHRCAPARPAGGARARRAGPEQALVRLRDAGRTWRAVACPGALRGSCRARWWTTPSGGRSYGFYNDGIHAFAGPALPVRAWRDDRLPAAPGAIVQVQAAMRPATPCM